MSRHGKSGFTVIETMIFLVVSAGVFAGGVAAYGDRQREVAFTQGVREFQSQLETVISDVSSGNYVPSPRTCKTPSASSDPIFPAISVIGNGECIYLGKALAVADGTGCAATAAGKENCTNFSIIPIVGRRLVGNNATDPNVSTFAEAKTLAVDGSGSAPDLKVKLGLTNGLSIYRVFERDASGNINGLVMTAFTSSLSNSSNFDTLNGSNAVDLVVMPISSPLTDAVARQAIKDLRTAPATAINPPHGVAYCIIGGNNQRAVITVGAGQRNTDVVVQATDALDPGCTI